MPRLRRGAQSIAQRGWRVLDKLTRGHYRLAKALFQLRLRWEERRAPNPLLVYQMGKVGSTSVVRSLLAAGWTGRIYQFHGVDPKNHAREEWFYRRNFGRDPQRPRHLWASQYFAQRLAARAPPSRPWQVVTLVRDPVARNLSSFFQILQLELDWAAYAGRRLTHRASVSELSRLFLEQVDWHDDPLEWFDVEFKPVFGMDVYASPFPRAQGYGIYANERAHVLVLKLEHLERCAREAFRRFLGLENFSLTAANVARAKPVGPLYQQFTASIILPPEYLDRMYTSRYAQHFYSAAELASFRARWQRAG